ncbi:MAG TPA: hypothetical protein VK587_05595 [bacterium]|nr:hypothetical protein [bacterium]
MQKLQWIAIGVIMGFVVAMAGGNLSAVRAQQQGPSPAEAQAILKQMEMQMTQMQQDMTSAHGMTMTPTEKAMQKELDEMAAMMKMLWQADNDLAQSMMNGSKNK